MRICSSRIFYYRTNCVAKEDMTNTNRTLDELRGRRDAILTEYAAGNKVVGQLIDLALLANGLLKGEPLSRFIRRSVELIG